jgi:hypothetical protein
MPLANGDPIVERARLRFQELRDIMARAEAVKAEYYQLDGFLRQAYQLFPDAFPEPPVLIGGEPQPASVGLAGTPNAASDGEIGKTMNSPRRPELLKTKDFAAWVLKVYGRQHIRDVLKRMRDEGWIGNPNYKRAAKTLFNTMSSHKNVFRNVGNNQWELIGEVSQAADEEGGRDR